MIITLSLLDNTLTTLVYRVLSADRPFAHTFYGIYLKYLHKLKPNLIMSVIFQAPYLQKTEHMYRWARISVRAYNLLLLAALKTLARVRGLIALPLGECPVSSDLESRR